MYWHQGCVNTATVSIQREGAKVRIHICEGANTYLKNDSSKLFSCIGASANTGPTCIRTTINSSRFFPACIGFVPEGKSPEEFTDPAIFLLLMIYCLILIWGLFLCFLTLQDMILGGNFYGRVRHYLTSNNCPKRFSIGNNRADIATQLSPLRML